MDLKKSKLANLQSRASQTPTFFEDNFTDEKPVEKAVKEKPIVPKKTTPVKDNPQPSMVEPKRLEPSGIFDIEQKGIVKPKRKKRGEKEEKNYKYASVYLPSDEYELLERLADSYDLTLSNFIRILILNSKMKE